MSETSYLRRFAADGGTEDVDRARFLYASIMRQVGDAGPDEADKVVGFYGKEPESPIKRFVVDGDIVGCKYERLELVEFDQRMSKTDLREWFKDTNPLKKWCDEGGFYNPDDGISSPAKERDARTDGGELPDDHSIRCYDCERVVDRRHVDFVEVPVFNEDGIGYDMVPVPLCKDCRLRRYGVECQHCGGYHWDIEGVVECERDRPSMLPDGGTEPAEAYHPDDPDEDPLRRRLPDEVYAAEADFARLAMKTMTARRMIGWLRAFAGYSDTAGHTASAEHARNVANRLAAEVEPESIEQQDDGTDAGRAPDARDIDDLVAIDVCPDCRAEPAVVIVTKGDDECYHCGGAIQ